MEKGAKTTAGYPHIEQLIDSEDFNDLNASFKKAYDGLEKIVREKRGLRAPREAKKAIVALEKVAELLKELLQVKYQLEEEAKKRAKKT